VLTVTTSEITCVLDVTKSMTLQCSLYDMAGRCVYQSSQQFSPGEQEFCMSLPLQLTKNACYLLYFSESGKAGQTIYVLPR
jgi:hypothetical protein